MGVINWCGGDESGAGSTRKIFPCPASVNFSFCICFTWRNHFLSLGSHEIALNEVWGFGGDVALKRDDKDSDVDIFVELLEWVAQLIFHQIVVAWYHNCRRSCQIPVNRERKKNISIWVEKVLSFVIC